MAENTKVFPITTKKFIDTIKEARRNGQRFCFILGSGASISSGIPMGRELERRWMIDLMKDPEGTEQLANQLFEQEIIETPFEKLKAAYDELQEKGKHIPSEYYFDIYKLRFYPDKRNGYKYLEKLMENSHPGIGYRALAQLLVEDTGMDIVITTNFDSLAEDALFIYTDKRPIVVAHESLADYIELSKNQRPVIAKVHRGLFYAPMNDRAATSKLSDEWVKVLGKIFSSYAPIVIGYAGGDGSLMSYLKKDTTEINGTMYWCLMKGEEPSEHIKNLVQSKDGCFVEISGFDDLMLSMGSEFCKADLDPSSTRALLEKNTSERYTEYAKQWDKWAKSIEAPGANSDQNLTEMVDKDREEEEKREKEGKLTAWDYFRRGNRSADKGNHKAAIDDYTKAIELKPDYEKAYNNRGNSYDEIGEYEKAIADYSKAIELKPDDADAYYNRGISYRNIGEYEKAIADYSKAIELKPDYEIAYNNRGSSYYNRGEYEKSIADYSKAIELKPDYEKAYNNRALAFRAIGKESEAAADEKKAKELEAGKK